MPTALEIDEARSRWREVARAEDRLAPIAAFHDRWLELLAATAAPDVTLRLAPSAADAAVTAGTPLLIAGELDVDLGELETHLHALEQALVAAGLPAADAASPSGVDDRLAAALRGEHRGGLDATRTLVELAVQPALWAAATQAAALTDLARWSRGYCPVCGAWPLYGELSGPQRERHLRCGRCGADWAWAVLLCPYCGNDDHRTLGHFENSAEREYRRVDTCEHCRGYVKAIAAFTPVSAVRLAAEDTATLHLDLAARERGYERPGRITDPALAGIPRSLNARRSTAS
jgi:formate dehydrogenase accessory protein FdhE